MKKVSVNFRLPQELVDELKQHALLVDKDMTRLVIEAIKAKLESNQVGRTDTVNTYVDDCIDNVNTYIDSRIDTVNTRIDTLQAEVAKLKSRLYTVEKQPSQPKPKAHPMPQSSGSSPSNTHEAMAKANEGVIKAFTQSDADDKARAIEERNKRELNQNALAESFKKAHEAFINKDAESAVNEASRATEAPPGQHTHASAPDVQGILETEPSQPREPQGDWLTTGGLYQGLQQRGFTKSGRSFRRLLNEAIETGELPAELRALGVEADFEARRSAKPQNNSLRWLRLVS